MISFDRQDKRFNHRVAGLRTHDRYVFLTRADQDDCWFLPGGRVNLLEVSRPALHLEFLVETGHEARVEDLPWTIETFSDLAATTFHKLAFVYTMSPTDPAILNTTWTQLTTDGDVGLRWFGLDDLERTTFRSAFLKPLLQDPPETPQHMIVGGPHQEPVDH